MKYSFKFLRNQARMMFHKITGKQMQNSCIKYRSNFKEKSLRKDFNQEIKH